MKYVKLSAQLIAGAVFVLSVLLSASVLASPGWAQGATGTPNLGTFAHNSVKCTGMGGDGQDEIRFAAASQGKMEMVFEVHTWHRYDYERFLGDELRISVNNHHQYTRGYSVVPAWDGVTGHEPLIELTLRDMPAGMPFYLFVKWAASPPEATSLLVSAYAGEQDCIITD